MRRIKSILAVVAAVVVMTALAAPAMAAEINGDDIDDGVLIFGGALNDDFVTGGNAALEFEQEDVQSGDVAPVVDISNAGDNANLAPTVVQSANSGNVQNEQGVTQFNSASDDIEFEGSSIEINPSVESDVIQTIQQSGVVTL